MTPADQIAALEAVYDGVVAQGYRDPLTGRTFPIDQRGRGHIASEAMAAAIVVDGGLASSFIGWRLEYQFPDIDGREVPFTAEDMLRLAQRMRVYYAWIWHAHAAVLRQIRTGTCEDAGVAWAAWTAAHPWGG